MPVRAATGRIQSGNLECIVLCGYEDEDRGHLWGPRQALPDFGLPALKGRTNYVLSGQDDALFLFVTPSAHKPKEGRVFAARTRDEERTWSRLGWVGPDHADGFSIQPSTVRLEDHRFVTATRWQRPGRSGVEIFRSENDGKTWRSMGNAVDTGARSTAHDLTRLRDGRLALTYAQRDRAQIFAKLSADEGATGPETGTSVIRALRRWPAGNGVVLG